MRRARWAILALGALALGACTAPLVGSPIPVQPLPSSVPGERITLEGVVDIKDSGCIDLDLGPDGTRWVVWPTDVTISGVGPLTAIGVVSDGHVLVSGDRIEGTGVLVQAADLPDWGNRNSGLRRLGGACFAQKIGVVALDEFQLISNPSSTGGH